MAAPVQRNVALVYSDCELALIDPSVFFHYIGGLPGYQQERCDFGNRVIGVGNLAAPVYDYTIRLSAHCPNHGGVKYGSIINLMMVATYVQVRQDLFAETVKLKNSPPPNYFRTLSAAIPAQANQFAFSLRSQYSNWFRTLTDAQLDSIRGMTLSDQTLIQYRAAVLNSINRIGPQPRLNVPPVVTRADALIVNNDNIVDNEQDAFSLLQHYDAQGNVVVAGPAIEPAPARIYNPNFNDYGNVNTQAGQPSLDVLATYHGQQQLIAANLLDPDDPYWVNQQVNPLVVGDRLFVQDLNFQIAQDDANAPQAETDDEKILRLSRHGVLRGTQVKVVDITNYSSVY